MTVLTPKREAFASGLAEGLSQAEAYRRAFPASLKWQEKSVWAKSSLLASDVNVRQRVAEIQSEVAERVLCSLEDHVGHLARLRGIAEDAGQISAAVKAEELRGKVCGLYAERVDVTVNGGVNVYLPANGRGDAK